MANTSANPHLKEAPTSCIMEEGINLILGYKGKHILKMNEIMRPNLPVSRLSQWVGFMSDKGIGTGILKGSETNYDFVVF